MTRRLRAGLERRGAGDGPVVRLRLIPYGAAKLRIAAFPVLSA